MNREKFEQILEKECDSLPAWTERRKECVLNAMQSAYKLALADTADGWISVKERLPEEEGAYIIYGKFTKNSNMSVYEAYFIKRSKTFLCYGTYSKSVTHWRLRPAPPKTVA